MELLLSELNWKKFILRHLVTRVVTGESSLLVARTQLFN